MRREGGRGGSKNVIDVKGKALMLIKVEIVSCRYAL